MDEAKEIDWSKCVICNEEKTDLPKCPKNRRNSDALSVYASFLENVRKFQDLDAMPVNISFSKDITAEILHHNNACWHNSCRQLFTDTMLARAVNKKRKHDSISGAIVRSSKRQSISLSGTKSSYSTCIFCSKKTNEKAHECSTHNIDGRLRAMAIEMEDTELLAKLAGGDVIAIEAKYHSTCMTKYKNKYRSYIRNKNKNSDSCNERAKARAFVELVDHIEEQIMSEINMFRLKDLYDLHQSRLQKLGCDYMTNKTRLKEKIISHFMEYGIQEQTVNKNVILIFPDGVKKLIKETLETPDYGAEALLFSRVAKICRNEICSNTISFDGNFSKNCQDIAPNTKTLISMLLYGPDLQGDIYETQPCNTITQLLIHNRKVRPKPEAHSSSSAPIKRRHSHFHEPPVPVYIGLNIHTSMRSKTMIEQFEKLGVSISYKRVLEIEKYISQKQMAQFDSDGLVCPLQLRHDLITVGAIDNIDHNPSSTTASGSLHGTAMTIMQHPTQHNKGQDRHEIILDTSRLYDLPDSYTIVPSLCKSTVQIPKVTMQITESNLHDAIEEENEWLSSASELLTHEAFDDYKAMSWSAFHAAKERSSISPPAIISLLPLFMEKADSPAMIKHGMDILMSATQFLNPGQMSILACDCPIYAQCKYLQWRFPELYGEEKMMIILGGLHTEKTLWKCLGDLLEKSGWTEALVESSVASTGTADSFLKVSHITRTRHAHQVPYIDVLSLLKVSLGNLTVIIIIY